MLSLHCSEGVKCGREGICPTLQPSRCQSVVSARLRLKYLGITLFRLLVQSVNIGILGPKRALGCFTIRLSLCKFCQKGTYVRVLIFISPLTAHFGSHGIEQMPLKCPGLMSQPSEGVAVPLRISHFTGDSTSPARP